MSDVFLFKATFSDYFVNKVYYLSTKAYVTVEAQ